MNFLDGLRLAKKFLKTRIAKDASADIYWLGPDQRIIVPNDFASLRDDKPPC